MWFSVKLLFKCVVEDNLTIPNLFEESIRIVWAENEDEVRSKAQKLGIKEEHEYKQDYINRLDF